MGLIFVIYLVFSLSIVITNITFSLILKLKYRLPISLKEKEVLKKYHGIEALALNIESYRDMVFHNIVLMLPLVFIGIIIDSGLAFLALAILFGVSRVRYIKLKNIVNNRKVEFFKEYPGFLNSLMLYLQAGLTLENALSVYFAADNYGYYLSLIKSSLDKINLGINRKAAFHEVILGTRERELIKLVNFFLQFYLVGGNSNSYLIRLAEDAWKLKKETIKQLAEEGSAKMVLPMMIIFIGVSLLVLIPSVFSIMNGNVF
ncbi:MAG: tight adherence protein C [Fusobacteria bacterium]|nr:MAG: tight adherence protein C [Fusobacteriota bacterium]KAF0228839.1 MAG: tight adherence protein [Fusobacteriota bacterium]